MPPYGQMMGSIAGLGGVIGIPLIGALTLCITPQANNLTVSAVSAKS